MVTAPQGDEQQFHVKRPAVDRLMGQNVAGDFAAEALETALRVFEAGDGQNLDVEVEHPAHEVTVARLIIAHRAGGLAAADGDVVLAQFWRQKLGNLGHGHGEVGVGHEEVLPLGGQHPGAHGRALALRHLVQHADVGA